ncbi:MAG TPA: alpha/beta hydrolase [Alphaproteobacteria bacterium]|jgi:pimeloyl-ACP methyl ester carboxylesterase|nr:alpha/beta hydrolase [Alphaproteobacteria bacterium]
MKPVVAVLTLLVLLCGGAAWGADSSAAPERPSWMSLFGEVQAALAPRPRDIPRDLKDALPGDGRPVIIFPAFFAGDWQTEPLRDFLTGKGYAVYGWDLGTNLGPTAFTLRGMVRRLDEVSAANRGARVTLIGHSLGGVLARELAKLRPEAVRQVIVLASPIHKPTASVLEPLYEALSILHGGDAEQLSEHLNDPPTVPVTAIYTRTDGVIAWESALETPGPRRENVEVVGPHMTMARNFDAWRVIVDRLRLGDAWRPYGRAVELKRVGL